MVATRYDADTNVFSSVAENKQDLVIADEEEDEMETKRQELLVTLRNIAKLVPQQAVRLMHDNLQQVLSDGNSPWQVRFTGC